MDKVLKQALKLIKPTKVEEKKLLTLARSLVKKIKIYKTKSVLGGSLAKGTWLKGNHDIDIYVKFDKQHYAGKDISSILKKELVKHFKKVETLHGSRDYFHIKKKGLTVEVVPIFDISSAPEALNITDVSPLHVNWVNKHNKKDEIRLAKAFCKANNVYGAESYIKGFSGYVIEILTIYYGSFIGFIKNAAKWDLNGKMIIDVEGYYRGKQVLDELNKAKSYSPLIVIDPVQKERNAAAGLNHENYKKLIQLATKFLSEPSLKFFKQQHLTLAKLKSKARNNKLIVIEATPLKGKKDIIGAKLLKCFDHLKMQLSANDFCLVDSGWRFNKKGLFWFILKDETLSKYKKHYGPPYLNKKAVNNFKKKWSSYTIEIENGRLYVQVKRKFRKPEQLIKKLLKSNYVQSRVKDISIKFFG